MKEGKVMTILIFILVSEIRYQFSDSIKNQNLN
jgi:hypothetical protein